MIWLAAACGVAAGYLVARIRPYRRAADWADEQVQFELDRWSTSFRMAVLSACLVVLHPWRMFVAWKDRNLED